ncbi:MAG: carbohydrate binding domain-containing protein [Terrimicrobiaceae bacterium]
MTKISVLMACLALLAFQGPLSGNDAALSNPGFEKNLEGWKVSSAGPPPSLSGQAAHEGNLGLHLSDPDAETSCHLSSDSVPVDPGQKVKLAFWARSSSPVFMGVSLSFRTQKGKWITGENDEKPPTCAIQNSHGEWRRYELEATAPDAAAAVVIWIHSYKTTIGEADLDDFDLAVQ